MTRWSRQSGAIQSHPSRPTFDDFDRTYVEWYDTRRGIRRFSRKQRSDGNADLLDIMDMMEILLEQHQMSFTKDDAYGWRLFFPYLFIKPEVGDEVRNTITGEIYTITWVEDVDPGFKRLSPGPIVRNPKENTFTGLVILQGNTEPKITDRLEFVERHKRILPFQEWGSRRHSKTPTESGEGDLGQGESGPFLPTLTWSVTRVEPGTVGKRPFDPAKMAKPIFRESYPDPQHTYLMNSEMYNRSVQQQHLYQTGNPLWTGEYSALTPAQQDPRVSTHTIEVYGQWFDNLVQFDCWSASNSQANALITWFEDFMELYTPVLKQNGVAEMLYWERLQDQTIERWRNDIDNRTIRWFFRTEKLRVRRRRNFRNFVFRLSVGSPNHFDETIIHTEPSGVGTWTGSYGLNPGDLKYDTFTGASGHFTGDGSYLWGQLTIEET